MKKTIQLSERDLHKIIAESVNRALNEQYENVFNSYGLESEQQTMDRLSSDYRKVFRDSSKQLMNIVRLLNDQTFRQKFANNQSVNKLFQQQKTIYQIVDLLQDITSELD